jgi:hypothetical protein
MGTPARRDGNRHNVHDGVDTQYSYVAVGTMEGGDSSSAAGRAVDAKVMEGWLLKKSGFMLPKYVCVFVCM